MLLDGERVSDEYSGIFLDRWSGTSFYAPFEEIRRVKLSSLRRALLDAEKDNSGQLGFVGYVALPRVASFIVSGVSSEAFDIKHSPMDDFWFDLGLDGHLLLCCSVELEGEEWTPDLVREILTPMLERVGAQFEDCGEYGDGAFAGNPWLWNVRVKPAMRCKTVADAFAVGRAVSAILDAVSGGGLDAATVWDLGAAGQVAAIFGQFESDWLEVKAMGWDLSTNEGKTELAQDVARFANGDIASIILVGIGTKKVSGVECLVQGPGLSFQNKDAQRHHQIVDSRVYPLVSGLKIAAHPDGRGGELLSIFVPEQPPESKPFLVHGAMAGEKYEGAFFSIVQRRGEQSVAVTPQSLHAQIVAGRAFIKMGINNNSEPRP